MGAPIFACGQKKPSGQGIAAETPAGQNDPAGQFDTVALDDSGAQKYPEEQVPVTADPEPVQYDPPGQGFGFLLEAGQKYPEGHKIEAVAPSGQYDPGAQLLHEEPV